MKDEEDRQGVAGPGQRLADGEIRGPDGEYKRCLQDLEAANSELDAVLYAVSHDFGAHLRGIQGFSQILLERYADKLDVKGQDYLTRIQVASRKIKQMVDELLQISRLSKVAMKIEDLDLSGIARSIAGRLGKASPARDVKFILAENIRAAGDKHLLTLVLKNLLDNAWKFTGKKEGAIIEFGVVQRGSERVYFVRDNGIGFDMIRADQLFKPFRKLHDEREFPGSGVGLAAVYRSIRRSAGKIWAASEEGKGTTIYFTLG